MIEAIEVDILGFGAVLRTVPLICILPHGDFTVNRIHIFTISGIGEVITSGIVIVRDPERSVDAAGNEVVLQPGDGAVDHRLVAGFLDEVTVVVRDVGQLVGRHIEFVIALEFEVEADIAFDLLAFQDADEVVGLRLGLGHGRVLGGVVMERGELIDTVVDAVHFALLRVVVEFDVFGRCVGGTHHDAFDTGGFHGAEVDVAVPLGDVNDDTLSFNDDVAVLIGDDVVVGQVLLLLSSQTALCGRSRRTGTRRTARLAARRIFDGNAVLGRCSHFAVLDGVAFVRAVVLEVDLAALHVPGAVLVLDEAGTGVVDLTVFEVVPDSVFIGRETVEREVDLAVLDPPAAVLVALHAGIVELDHAVKAIPPAVLVLVHAGVFETDLAVDNTIPAVVVLCDAGIAKVDLTVHSTPPAVVVPCNTGIAHTGLALVSPPDIVLGVIQFDFQPVAGGDSLQRSRLCLIYGHGKHPEHECQDDQENGEHSDQFCVLFAFNDLRINCQLFSLSFLTGPQHGKRTYTLLIKTIITINNENVNPLDTVVKPHSNNKKSSFRPIWHRSSSALS